MRPETETERLRAATQSLAGAGLDSVRVAIVLGSGLKGFGSNLTDRVKIPFHDVANWPVPRVEGHGAELIIGGLGDHRVACLTGRVHLYEGWHPSDVVRPVRTLRTFGIESIVLTNAAGGLGEGMRPGDLMAITDHLNLTGLSPLVGAHEDALGPRFPDQSAIYDPSLVDLLTRQSPQLRRGVYAGMLGPNYETPAEIRMLRTCGVDAVGMSTVHEAMAVSAMGARVAGISLISNLAAGVSDVALDHQEVLEAGVAAADEFTQLLLDFCKALPDVSK